MTRLRSSRSLFTVGRAASTVAVWQAIGSAPFDRAIGLAVWDDVAMHALAFPCRRILCGWINAQTKERVDVHPTHWCEWIETA
jgi:hypothetical protein